MPDSRRCVCLVCGKRSLKLICDQCAKFFKIAELHRRTDRAERTPEPGDRSPSQQTGQPRDWWAGFLARSKE
jgi:hypothetical protein